MATIDPDLSVQPTDVERIAALSADEIDDIRNSATVKRAARAMYDGDPDDEVRDENGLTKTERDRWLAHYTAIGTMMHVVMTDSPTHAEAQRRVALLKLELRVCEEALKVVTPEQWGPGQ